MNADLIKPGSGRNSKLVVVCLGYRNVTRKVDATLMMGGIMSARIKGTVLLSRKSLVAERFGADHLEGVIASMATADQELLRGMILPLSWYAAETCQRFDAAIIKIIGGNAEKAFRELGRKSAEDNLGKFQAGFVRVMGWHERALEMVGAKKPALTHPACRANGAAACVYHVSWS